jgi:hypothetical protein
MTGVYMRWANEDRLVIPMYESPDLDAGAQAFGTKFRAKLQGDGPKRV